MCPPSTALAVATTEVEISVKADVQDALRQLGRLGSEVVPKAAAAALNETAFDGRKAAQEEMKSAFDRPTRWTLNAPWVVRARSFRLQSEVNLQGKAFKSTDAHAYLDPQIHGGPRPPKRSEKLLRARGILPPGMFTVPGAGARIDSHGNMSRGQIQQILAQVRAHFDPYQRTPRGRSTEYFHAILGGTNGIWRRKAGGVVPVLVFVRQPQYRPRFRFYDVVNRAVESNWRKNFEQQISVRLRRGC